MTSVINKDAVFELIKGELTDLGVEQEITAETEFNDLEIDSLDAADLMTRIKAEYGVELHRSKLADITVGGLVDQVVDGAGQ
jgi:acyl carrier protein